MSYILFQGLWNQTTTNFAIAVVLAFALFLLVILKNWSVGAPVIPVGPANMRHRSARRPRTAPVAKRARHRSPVRTFYWISA